jgi:hypothetical protein
VCPPGYTTGKEYPTHSRIVEGFEENTNVRSIQVTDNLWGTKFSLKGLIPVKSDTTEEMTTCHDITPFHQRSFGESVMGTRESNLPLEGIRH